jgi:membrane protease YdiL (CAAX protease family)
MSNASSNPNKGFDPTAPVEKPISSVSVPPVPWNPWLGVVYVVVAFYVAQLLGGILISIYPVLHHWSSAQSTDWLNNSIGAQFVYVLLAETFSVGAIYAFLRYHKVGFRAIALKRPRWRDPVYGLLAVIPYYVLYILTVGVVSHFVRSLNVNQTQELGFNDVHGAAQLLMTGISLVILPPIAEEIMVRGFLYGSLKKGMPQVVAVIVTSLIFASAHLPEGGAAGPLYIAALDTFVLSLVLIYLREKTGSLWASMTLHATKNGLAFVALFVLHVH